MKRAITPGLLATLFVGFKTHFRNAFAAVEPQWAKVATKVPSTTKTETYSWLGAWPSIREWIGDRIIKKLSGAAYTLKNRKFETTVSVQKDDIEDDTMGIYGSMFQELGRLTKVFPDELVFGALKAGITNKCYDGQPFFDDEHPVGDTDNPTLVANYQAGAGHTWYLLDCSRSLKPIILQERREFDITALDQGSDVNVFMRDEYVYGADGRYEAGYGFWQMAFASKADLTPANFEAAVAAMGEYKDDEGKSLKIRPTILVVPPRLEGAGKRLMNNDKINGSDNEWKGACELLVVSELA